MRSPACAGSIALIACGLVASACSVQRPRPPAPPAPTPDWADAPTPVQLQARVAARNAALQSFQGQGSLEYEGPDGKVRSAHMVVVKAPDKVRIDFRSPFSLTYTVASNGQELAAYDRGEKVLYRGLPTARNLGRYTRVAVDLEMLALLVRGIPPLPAGAGLGRVRPVEAGWLWEVPTQRGGRVAMIFDAEGLSPRRAVVREANGRDLSAFFDDYEDVGGVEAAHSIRAELPGGGRVLLKYGTIWRDRVHSDSAFRLEPPDGVRVVDMDELDEQAAIEADR